MIPKRRVWCGLFASGFAGLMSHSVAFGQGNVFNPYGNSGYADYREFANPIFAPDPSLPGQARIQAGLYGRSRANQYQSYVEGLDGSGVNPSNSRLGAYGQGSQGYGQDNSRIYRANNTPADRAFRERQAQRDAAYNQAMEERDPRKRAALMQQIDRDSLDRPLSATTLRLAAQARADEARAAKNSAPPASAARRVDAGSSKPATRGGNDRASGRADAPSRTKTPSSGSASPAPEPAAIPTTSVNSASIPITPPQ